MAQNLVTVATTEKEQKKLLDNAGQNSTFAGKQIHDRDLANTNKTPVAAPVNTKAETVSKK